MTATAADMPHVPAFALSRDHSNSNREAAGSFSFRDSLCAQAGFKQVKHQRRDTALTVYPNPKPWARLQALQMFESP